MKRIFKYTPLMTDTFNLDMPKGARILSLQTQQGTVQMWAIIDDDSPLESRQFRIYGTGQAIDDAENLRFIDTFQLYGGDIVFHLFEIAAW